MHQKVDICLYQQLKGMCYSHFSNGVRNGFCTCIQAYAKVDNLKGQNFHNPVICWYVALVSNLSYLEYFENIQAENDDQNLVQQVNEEPIQTNTDLCVLCINPQNGTTNWGFLHNGEVHHNYCEACKDNLDKKPGDLCPLCDSPIDLVVKMSWLISY